MRNNRLLPYETIVQATSGEPEAVGTVLQYYRRRIQCAARVNGRVDQDTEDYITQTLLTAIFKFRFGRWPYRLQLNNRRFAGNQKAVNLFNRFAAFFRSCLAFLKIPSMKKQKGKLPPQLAKSLTYPWRVSKKKILPLSAFFGLRGVVGNKGKF